MTVGIEGHEEAIKDCIRHENHVALLANSNEMRHKMNTFVSKKLNIPLDDKRYMLDDEITIFTECF